MSDKNPSRLKINEPWSDAIGKAIKKPAAAVPPRETKPRKKKPSGEKPKG